MGKRRAAGQQTGGLVDRNTFLGQGEVGSRHPLAQQIREEFDLNTPGVGHGLTRLAAMRRDGKEITIEEARACIQTYVDHHARLIAKAEEKARRSVVYYMRLGDLVKIGWTTNLQRRRDVINPQEVMATEPGGRQVELRRHRQFDDLRVHGEWFQLEPPLTEWIKGLKAASADEEGDVDERDMISTKDAVKIYKVPYTKLRLWADEGRICKPERRGRELYWDAAEVEQMRDLLGDRKRLPRVTLQNT